MLNIRSILLILSVLLMALPAYADLPFEEELLDETEIKIKKQPQEKKGKETPYLFYGEKRNKLFVTTRDGLFSFIPTFTLQFRQKLSYKDLLLDSNTFSLRRARIQLNGTFLNKNLKYEYDVELQTPATDRPAFKLQDFYLDYQINDWAMFKVGQYKMPLSYQFHLSGIRLQFPNRSLANEAFSVGRDLGILYHGQLPDKSLLYGLGIFNGEGPNRLNINKDFAYLAKVFYTPLGRYPAEESDVEYQETPKLLFTGQAWLDQDPSGQDRVLTSTAFSGFKWRGFSLQGHYFNRQNFTDQVTTLNDLDGQGFYVQIGHFFIPKKLEGALRTSHVYLAGDANDQHEYAAAINYYILDNRLKLQMDYTLFQFERANQNSPETIHQVLSQIQMAI